MNTGLCCKFIRFSMFMLLAVSLASCNEPPAKVEKSIKRTKPAKAQLHNAVKNIKIQVEKDPVVIEEKETGIPETDSEAKIIDVQPHIYLVLDYKNDGDQEMHKALVLISPKPDNIKFPELIAALNQLEENKSVLHNIRIEVTKPVSEENAGGFENSFNDLTAIDKISIELNLIRFFIDNRKRDASYIVVDNTKKALASLPGAVSAKKGKQLSSELETLESDVRRIMPFTL